MSSAMDNLEQLMQSFCRIVMPGHDNPRGYINVKKKVKELNINRRTYYYWKERKAYPQLKDMVKRLNDKGYKLQIVLNEDAYK